MNKTMLAILVTTILAPFALATHTPQGGCDSEDAPALGIIQVGEGDDAYYIDDRNLAIGNGLWVYEETNGIWVAGDTAHSIQRGGASPYVPDDSEICVDDPLVIPDTFFW